MAPGPQMRRRARSDRGQHPARCRWKKYRLPTSS
jgi:hypothetical protein